jgi:hypothetical protein
VPDSRSDITASYMKISTEANLVAVIC